MIFCRKFLFILICCFSAVFSVEKPFVVIITSYNNSNFVEDNLRSVFSQKYDNFRVIYINDNSHDDTLAKVKDTVDEYNFNDKVILIDNRTRKGSLHNHYEAITNYTHPSEVVVLLDGDDSFIGRNVLSCLNEVYSDKNIWFTFGQFVFSSRNQVGFCCEFGEKVIKENSFRSQKNMPSHLKTFYSWLFQKIQLKDFMYNKEFFSVTGDLAIVLPLIEMAGIHYKFIDRPLYLYNDENPLNDHKVQEILQNIIANYIRNLPSYEPLDDSYSIH